MGFPLFFSFWEVLAIAAQSLWEGDLFVPRHNLAREPSPFTDPLELWPSGRWAHTEGGVSIARFYLRSVS